MRWRGELGSDVVRVIYDNRGRRVGYSVPLWLVAVKWLVIVGLVALPAYGLMALFGWQDSQGGRIFIGVWTCFWLALGAWLKHVAQDG